MFKRAERKKAKLRLALLGPSGSGKTYSALQIAKGLGGSIAMIDTENGSGELYAHLCDYDVCQIMPPFTPEKYVEAIKFAEQAGYGTIIVDSLSHAWSGSGGLLEQVDQRKGAGNQFSAWRDITPMHNQFVDAMVQSSAHIIATMRTKTGYEMQKNDKGKVVPVKVGLQPVQRDGLEYEFTVVFDLDLDKHVAHASKDRTTLFDGQYFTPTPDTGKQLFDWLDSGVDPDEAMVREATEAIEACSTVTALQKLWATNNKRWQARPVAFAQILAKKDEQKDQLAPPTPGNPFEEGGHDSAASEEPQEQPESGNAPMTDAQRKAIMAYFKGAERAERLASLSSFFQCEIESTNDLTKDMASQFIDAINQEAA